MKKNPEEIEHIKIVQHLQILKKSKKIIEYWATINEVKSQKRNPKANMLIALKNKRMGKLAGVSDLTIIFKNLTLYIEMKRNRKILKSGKLSKENLESSEQENFREKINQTSSSVCYVCYGYMEAIERIKEGIRVNDRIKVEKTLFSYFV